MSAAKRIKIVAIGDGNVGKTSMLISYSTGEIPEDYVPTVFDNFRTQINTSHGEITLDIWDTAGQEEYAEIRKLAFNNVDVFLVCFSIGNPTSLENLESKWINDVAESESPGAKVGWAHTVVPTSRRLVFLSLSRLLTIVANAPIPLGDYLRHEKRFAIRHRRY